MNNPPTAQSPLHAIYEAQGARMAHRDGWHVPLHFGSPEAEIEAARTAVAAAEPFGLRVLDLFGEALPDLAAHLGAGEAPPGTAVPSALPAAEEARWLRLTRTHARILIGRRPPPPGPLPQQPGEGELRPGHTSVPPPPELGEGVRGWGLEGGPTGDCLHVRDVTSGLSTLALIGPRGPAVLARLVRLDSDPRVFVDHTVALTGAAGIPLQILRWDRGPFLIYELTVGRDVAEYFWDALSHAGEDAGLRLIGDEAFSRIEGVGRSGVQVFRCSGVRTDPTDPTDPSNPKPEHLNT